MTMPSPIPPKGVSHIAIGVRSIDRSLLFYRDMLGMNVSLDAIEAPSKTWNSGRRRAAYLKWSSGDTEPMIVLDQLLDPPGPQGEPKPMFAIGVHHFGLWVESVERIVERARAAGEAIWIEPVTGDTKGYGEAPGGRIRTALLRDPDGNVVQVDERLSAPF